MLLSDSICGPTRCEKALNLIFPKLSSQNVRGFDHTMILSPSFNGLCKEHLAQSVIQIREKVLRTNVLKG